MLEITKTTMEAKFPAKAAAFIEFNEYLAKTSLSTLNIMFADSAVRIKGSVNLTISFMPYSRFCIFSKKL